LFVNTVVEEPKNKVSDAASYDRKARHKAANVIPTLDLCAPEKAAAQSQDSYESCLELSALFLGRG
jgi:hypothetical protein